MFEKQSKSIDLDNSTEQLDSATKDKLSAALLDNIYRRIVFAQTAAFICALIIFIGLFDKSKNNSLLIGWFIFFVSVLILRLFVFFAYIKVLPSERLQIKFWKPLFIFSTALAGITWGMVSSTLFNNTTPDGQVLIIIMLAGITAGAISALSAELISIILFLSCCLVPLFITLTINSATYIPPIFGVAIVLYYIYCIMAALRTHKMIINNLILTFKNDNLLKDLTEAKQQLEESNKSLELLATHDPLTGLANRYLFHTILNTAIKRAERDNTILAVFYLDIDNFKEINDEYGHDVGDQLLKIVAARIKERTRKPDIAFRLGGDEFAIILEKFTHKNDVSEVAKDICQSIAMLININKIEFHATCSIGICLYPASAQDAHILLKKADRAMYAAKDVGGNTFLFSE